MILIYCVFFAFSVFHLTIPLLCLKRMLFIKTNTTLFLIDCLYCVLCHGRVLLFLQKLVLTNW
jgi:hypothetical protein